MSNEVLDTIADSINPALVLLAIAAPWISRKAFYEKGSLWSFWVRTLLGLMVVYSIQFIDNRLTLWPRFGLDYSTHTAFAVSIATSLGMVSRRWLIYLVPILIAYAGIMMYLEYHSFTDILTAALVVVLPTWLIHQIGKRGTATALNTDSGRLLN